MAGYIFRNGTIITMDDRYPCAGAVGVAEGKIVAVGAPDDVAAVMPGAESRDLNGATLLPGFIDGHSHFPTGGFNRLFGVDTAVTTMEELKRRLGRKAKEPRSHAWIVGYGFDEQFMEGQRHPSVRDMDEASSEYPIFMRHVTGHTGYANSRALELAGVTKETPDPPGGVIGRDASGRPDGRLEGIPAQTLVRRLIPPCTPDDMKEALRAESMVYAAAGITTAQGGPAFSPMDAEMGYAVTECFLECARDGTLPVRAVLFVRADTPEKLEPYTVTRAGSDLSGCGMVTLGAAKLWVDGDPRSRTARFSMPYAARPGDEEEHFGEYLYTVDELRELMLPMHRRGWQIAVHANGDAGIERALRAFESLQSLFPRPDARHLIIHAAYATRSQLMRMARSGVYPCFFTAPLYFWDQLHAAVLGGARVADMCPLGDAARLGLRFNIHTDSPILPVAPLTQVGVAVTRTSRTGTVRGRHQAIGAYEALRAVTIDAAFLNGEEAVKGSLAPGKYADFVVLERSPLAVPAGDIRAIKVLAAIVGGRDVYGAPGSHQV